MITIQQKVPRTMTQSGLGFLTLLARIVKPQNGVILEIGPLFGSSTNALDSGRQDKSIPIHTIDTFEAAPWVKKRLGIDLSRKAFDKYTKHIDNLIVHQGFAPDIVKESWHHQIDMYFDDATHGNPGWIDNYNFFKSYFTDSTIICGDDYASGWPDIIKNVKKITDALDTNVYIVGRVWAFSQSNQGKIEETIDKIFAPLKGLKIKNYARKGNLKSISKLATFNSWLHQENINLKRIELIQEKGDERYIRAQLTDSNGKSSTFDLADGFDIPDMGKEFSIKWESNIPNIAMQYCVRNIAKGKTENTKEYPMGIAYKFSKNETINAIRFSS